MQNPGLKPSPPNYDVTFPGGVQADIALEKAQDDAMSRYINAKTTQEREQAHQDFMRISGQVLAKMKSTTDWLHEQNTEGERAQQDAQAIQQGIDQPKLGVQRGRLYTLPQYNQLGPIRPFGPGEWLDRGDGNWSSEETRTVPYGNGYAVVPGLWMVNGQPVMVDEEQAAQYAQQSRLNWPTFPDLKSAEDFATQREARWQTVPIGRSDMQQPLWSRPWPPQ
jgi:hypothetical protein